MRAMALGVLSRLPVPLVPLRRGLLAAVVALAALDGAAAAQAPPPRLAVYESEANAARYAGAHQAPLREWLAAHGYAFDLIADERAGDPAALAPYAAVLATSSYIVPEAAARGLCGFAEAGGVVIWIDSPALCSDADLRALLGLGEGTTYATLSDCTLRCTQPAHPATLSVSTAALRTAVGNPATTAHDEAVVLYELTGHGADGTAVTYPGVTVGRRGVGYGLCINWILWLSREPEVGELLDDALLWALAVRAAATDPPRSDVYAPRTSVRQPEPLGVDCKIAGSSAEAGPLRCEVSLRAAASPTAAATRSATVELTHTDGALRAGIAHLQLPTEGLGDGGYETTVRWEGRERSWESAGPRVVLQGEAYRRLTEAQKERHALLQPRLANTLGDYDAEPRTADGRVDLPRLLEQIQTAHMNMYDWLIWHAPTDWEDLQRFLPLAQAAGIKVWVTLAPPTESGGGMPYSEPFRLDFVRWADEIGRLSEQYDNLAALVIDDFLSGANETLFTPHYITQVVDTLRAHNPRVAFLPVIYINTAEDEAFWETYLPLIDGVVFPYGELEATEPLRGQLEAFRKCLGADKFLMINVYASGSDGRAESGPRSEAYMREVLTTSHDMCDGIRIYCLPKDRLLDDARYRITAELYERWGAEARGQNH